MCASTHVCVCVQAQTVYSMYLSTFNWIGLFKEESSKKDTCRCNSDQIRHPAHLVTWHSHWRHMSCSHSFFQEWRTGRGGKKSQLIVCREEAQGGWLLVIVIVIVVCAQSTKALSRSLAMVRSELSVLATWFMWVTSFCVVQQKKEKNILTWNSNCVSLLRKQDLFAWTHSVGSPEKVCVGSLPTCHYVTNNKMIQNNRYILSTMTLHHFTLFSTL